MSDPKHAFRGRNVLVQEIKLSIFRFQETDFNSSYAIRSRFYLELNRVNLNENRKERGLEVSNQLHAKALGERPTGGAGRPAPMAKLRGPFTDVQARCTLFQGGCFG